MICAQCGDTESEGAAYCSNCGAALASQATSRGETAGPALEAVKIATAPPSQTTYAPPQTDPYQQDYERAKAAELLKPQQQGRGLGAPKGFMASLFDFGFNSFVTPKVVKVVYVLIMILLALGELTFAVVAFRISPASGIIALLILCPVSFFVYLALWRILLEIFMVIFRIAEDLQAIRTRGDLRNDGTAAPGVAD
jgi:hypothetical protein